jgi:NADH:ubiquinone oxidoreductase subunit 6 (subunit J)
MNFLLPLASLLGLEVDHLTDRIKHAVIINAIMAVFGLLGAGFLVAAGYIALAQQVGALYAALIFGGAFLLLALAVYLGAQIGEGRRKRELAQKRRSSEAGAFLTTATLAALPMLLRSPLLRTLGIPAAAIAAYLLVSNGGGDGDED